MAWVRFTANFDFKPIKMQTTAYLAGMVANVTTRCAAEAVAAGKAVRLKKPSKAAEPIEVSDDDSRQAD